MGRVHELTGRRFGKLLVIGKTPNQKGKTCWICDCDCGKKSVTVYTHALMRGKTSCGCDTRQKIRACYENKREDLTGKSFGYWTVIGRDKNEYDKKNHMIVKWLCKCRCGTVSSIRESLLKSGHSKSCGCYQKERASESHIQDLTGMKFGRLTVVDKVSPYISPQGAKLSKYKCKCDCGGETVVLSSHLTSGLTTSCGCYKKEIISELHSSDLIGQRFGKLTVISKIGSETHNGQARIVWNCLCDCGNSVQLNTNVLTSGNTTSCGCKQVYKGEEKIKDYLESRKINYVRQKMFDELSGLKGWKLRYDFFVPSANLLIEYQGRQHYEVVQFSNSYDKAEESFAIQQENDNLKREYAKANNIELLEIPYTEYENIENILKAKLI